MCSGGEGQQWTCGKSGVVSLQKVGSLVRDLSEPCLLQSRIQIDKMLKPEKWKASFDSDGRVSGFQKTLKSIILGGIDPSIRAEVWEFLLGCYALSSTSEQRNQLRVARRKRYEELLKQCQNMHSSVGTGALAYVIGSKVLDMRKSYRDEVVKVATDENRDSCTDNNDNTENHSDWSNNGTDTLHVHRRESSSESVDLASGRESPESIAYNTSSFVPASRPCGFASPDPYISNGFYDFPSLPVTDLFGRSSLDKIAVSTPQEDASLQSELRSDDEGMHVFQVDKNADLVIEHHRSTCEIEVMHNDSVGPPSHSGDSADMVDGVTVTEDGKSEWLWTLHRIVVDVVRTDGHLEFYEDPGNLGKMSDILAVYALVDPATGYCQGMSDLVSPFVILFEDNADAFWCFEMLIRRTRANFQMEGPTGVMNQLQSLWHILQLTDKDIFSHLSRIGAESLHFAFRMLLVLFRRELSFNESLRMWEMMWAADYDESAAETLENDCLKPLVIQQLPRQDEVEDSDEQLDDRNGNSTKREPTSKIGPISKSGPLSKSSLLSMSSLLPKSGPLPKTSPLSDDTGIKSASIYNFCGLTRSLWSRNDRTHAPSVASSIQKGDDAVPVFCVAAILIMNRHKIMKEARSIEDMIQIFNDKVLVFRVRQCVRTAIKLRKKYLYKVSKAKSHTHYQDEIHHQTYMESQSREWPRNHDETQSQKQSLHHNHVARDGD